MHELLTKRTAHDPLSIYIGDSLTDLQCLSDADVGICMYIDGGGPLKDAFDHWGTPILHISRFRLDHQQKYYWANDFEEITVSRLMRPWLRLSAEEHAAEDFKKDQLAEHEPEPEEAPKYYGPTFGDWDQPSVGPNGEPWDVWINAPVTEDMPSLPTTLPVQEPWIPSEEQQVESARMEAEWKAAHPEEWAVIERGLLQQQAMENALQQQAIANERHNEVVPGIALAGEQQQEHDPEKRPNHPRDLERMAADLTLGQGEMSKEPS